jgi:hypothetical protein
MAGSIGNLASSATVAASLFSMQAADPTPLINKIDPERWNQIKRRKPAAEDAVAKFQYVEPAGESEEADGNTNKEKSDSAPNASSDLITGKVQVLGEYIDTDAV